MISSVKFVSSLLLLWMLFMASNSTVNLVAAFGTPISQQQQEELVAKQQQQQQQHTEWYQQQLELQKYQQQEQNRTFPANPAAVVVQLPDETVGTAGEDFTTATTLPNGVDFSNQMLRSTEDSVNEDDEKLPREVQKAVCTVTAGEVRASAEAVTTKKLEGVCGSVELKLAFSDLEAKLYNELREVKMLLRYMAEQQGFNMPQMPTMVSPTTASNFKTSPTAASMPSKSLPFSPTSTTTPQLTAPLSHPLLFPGPTKATAPKFQPILMTRGDAATSSVEASYEYEEPSARPDAAGLTPKKPSQLKLVHTKGQGQAPQSNELLQEVRRFNNTMLSDRELKVFTYYWKLENFTERILSGRSTIVESPTFSIKGKPLYLKAYFQHLHRDFLYLQLAYANPKSSNSSSNRSNIIIDMGVLFKEITNDKMSFKHKISILNQQNQRSKDLTSQEFLNLETGFLIPNSALLGSPYIENDTLLIQIFLYL